MHLGQLTLANKTVGNEAIFCYCNNYVEKVCTQVVEPVEEIANDAVFCYCDNSEPPNLVVTKIEEPPVVIDEPDTKICNSSSSSSCDEEEILPEPQVAFFQEKISLSRYRMSLKNTGSCRAACKIVSHFGSLVKEVIGEPCFLDPGEEWELDEDDSRSLYFRRHARKYFVHYAAARSCEKVADKALRNDARNKSFELEVGE